MGSQHTTQTIASNIIDDIFNNNRSNDNNHSNRPQQTFINAPQPEINHYLKLISITIAIETDRQDPNKHVLTHKFKETDTILAIKQVIETELNIKLDTINLYHMTMDCLFEDDKTLKYYRITDSYTMRHVPSNHDDIKEADSKKEKIKIDKDTFIKTSKTKKNHYLKFPTLTDYAQQSLSGNTQKVTKLTNEILSKPPSGDPKQRDTLLHVLNGVAKANGKTCAFFDSSQGIKSDLAENSYLNAVDGDDKEAAKFVVTLKNLDQFVDEQEEKKYDKADKLIEIKESLSNKTYNPIVNDIRNKLATAHGVTTDRIIINDIYLNGVGVAYYVKDLTDNEKNKIITESKQYEGKMRKLFNDYARCAIHPALLQNSYDISMFDKAGNKTFGATGSKYKVGPPGKEKEYTQPAGWTRYGLKVLGKYGDDKWLHPFQDAGNWYRAYHGTKRESGSNIIGNGFDIKYCTGFAYGKGIYSSPNITTAQGYSRQITIETKQGTKKFWYVLQVAVNPATMNNASLIPNWRQVPHYIVPSGADIRPYGILIKEV